MAYKNPVCQYECIRIYPGTLACISSKDQERNRRSIGMQSTHSHTNRNCQGVKNNRNKKEKPIPVAWVLAKSNRGNAQGDARINDKDKTCGKTTEMLWYFQNTDIRKIALESKLIDHKDNRK